MTEHHDGSAHDLHPSDGPGRDASQGREDDTRMEDKDPMTEADTVSGGAPEEPDE